jgi:4,5-DOPA dioxygenase extradiol
MGMVEGQVLAAFVGHGSPTNALEENRWTRAWEGLGRRLGTPRAVLSVSAHWYVPHLAVTAMERPRTIHDFYGFPPELFAVEYPAPGAPGVAEEVADLLRPRWVGLDRDTWGLDHGTWVVLSRVLPDASVPVVQLSVNAAEEPAWHFELGAALAPLLSRGVFVLASGNVVHNLRLMDWSRPDAAFDFAQRFDKAAAEALLGRPASVPDLTRHDDYRLASPTPDHFLPFVCLAGLAEAAGLAVEPFAEGVAYGSVSMTSYALRTAGSPERAPAPFSAGEAERVPPGERGVPERAADRSEPRGLPTQPASSSGQASRAGSGAAGSPTPGWWEAASP